ncbi:MAG: hypothetical protein R2861_14790 [Desulfobacterales bacterium]
MRKNRGSIRSGGGETTAAQFNISFLGKILLIRKFAVAGDAGRSFQEESPESPAAQAFSAVWTKSLVV